MINILVADGGYTMCRTSILEGKGGTLDILEGKGDTLDILEGKGGPLESF